MKSIGHQKLERQSSESDKNVTSTSISPVNPPEFTWNGSYRDAVKDTIQGKGKRRSNLKVKPLDNDAKLMEKREKNRMAAAKSRNQRKQKIEDLTRQNEMLKRELVDAHDRIKKLTDLILSGRDSM